MTHEKSLSAGTHPRYPGDGRPAIESAEKQKGGRIPEDYGSTEGGIVFDGQAEDLEISTNDKKRSLRFFFRIEGKSDTYEVSLSAGCKEYGTLSISCQRRQPISCYETISPLE
jgi:hypothetical protein